MITGSQVREARRLLRMSTYSLAERARVRLWAVERAEATDGLVPLSVGQASKLKSTLEAAGVEFIAVSGGRREVRRRSS